MLHGFKFLLNFNSKPWPKEYVPELQLTQDCLQRRESICEMFRLFWEHFDETGLDFRKTRSMKASIEAGKTSSAWRTTMPVIWARSSLELSMSTIRILDAIERTPPCLNKRSLNKQTNKGDDISLGFCNTVWGIVETFRKRISCSCMFVMIWPIRLKYLGNSF